MTIEKTVDVKIDLEFDDVEKYIRNSATFTQKQDIFDMIEGDIELPEPEIEGIEVSPRHLLEEMALAKVSDFIQLHGIQALADKL